MGCLLPHILRFEASLRESDTSSDLFILFPPSCYQIICNTRDDQKNRSDRRKEATASLLREDEQARRVRVHGAETMQPKEQSFFYKLFGSSIDSLTVQVLHLPLPSPFHIAST